MAYDPESDQELAGSVPYPLLLGQFFYRSFLWAIAVMGLDIFVVFIMVAFLGVTLWRHGASIRLTQDSVLYPIGMMTFLLVTRSAFWIRKHFREGNGTLELQQVFLQTLRDWIPFILIDFIYENLHDLSRFFNTHDVAGTIMMMDVKIFGVEPTLWAQRFFNPLLVDTMAFAYALYFLFPLFIMYFLSFKNMRGPLKEVILALAITFLLGFLGYVFFPCSPPRYFLEHQFTHPPHLYGTYIFNQLQGRWDNLSAVRAGAFPSLHVGISAIALIYAFRLRHLNKTARILYWIYVPLILSLWISTVYLRHHWFIDIAAGWILAWFSCWVAPLLTRSWEELRSSLSN